jgi:hypothetical protein
MGCVAQKGASVVIVGTDAPNIQEQVEMPRLTITDGPDHRYH